MELFRQKKITLFNLHEKFENTMDNLNLLRNFQNTLVNDTQKLAGSLNLTQVVLRKHKVELDDLQTSFIRFKARLSAINEELIFLFK